MKFINIRESIKLIFENRMENGTWFDQVETYELDEEIQEFWIHHINALAIHALSVLKMPPF